ncbi:MAG: TIR domain-containing protein [Pseudomonadota bacterium]
MATRLADLRVMLSYARADAQAFTRELADALEAANFDVLLDVDDIEAATDWQERLSDMIRSVDTLVIVLTPGWIASEMCQWELEEAKRQNKRIIPLVHIEPSETPPPEEISKLNYIYFDQRQSFGAALKQLAPALRVNLGWIRNHTHYSESARIWEDRHRDPAMFLRGAELKRAQVWRDERELEFPEISAGLNEFINLSVEHETLQTAVKKRSTSWIIAVFLIVPSALIVTNGYTFWMNFLRVQTMEQTDLREFLGLLAWLIFMDNFALSVIVCGVLFSIGALWLSKNLSTRVLAGIAATLVLMGAGTYFAIDRVSIGVAERAEALDRAASLDQFKIEPCAPTIRRAFDRYRAIETSEDDHENISACTPHAQSNQVINTWRARVAPMEFIPIILLLTLPVLGLIGWRLSGRARS